MKFKTRKRAFVLGTGIMFLTALFGGFLSGCGKMSNNSGPNPAPTPSGAQTFAALTNTKTYARGLTVDSSGNVYVAGRTTANFLPCYGSASSCPSGSQGTTDYFITKYTNSGTRLWTQQLGRAGTISGLYAIAIDKSSNIYVAGASSNSIISNNVSSEYFISKYSANGNLIWSQQLAGGSANVSAMALDSSSNIYIFGTTNKNLVSCNGVSSSCSGNSQGSEDYFISKYTSSGNWVWTKQLGETGQMTGGYGGAVDSSGNAYIMGATTGNLASCNGVSSACSGGAQGTEDYYISKYASNGAWVWTKQLGEAGQSTEGLSVSIDSSANVYVTGRSTGNLVSCSGVSSSCSGAAQGQWDYFVSKYSSAGTWGWTKQLGESGTSTTAIGTAVDASSNVYVTGYTTANLASCNGVSASCSGSAQGVYDYFISKYASDGTWDWTKQLGETNLMALGSEIYISPTSNLYLAGDTTGNLASCNGVSTSCSGSAQGTQDYFISKYTTGGNWVSTNQL